MKLPIEEQRYYRNIGVNPDLYQSQEQLDYELWWTDRESVFDEDTWQPRVKYADSDFLAIRAFIFNIIEYFQTGGGSAIF